MIFNARVRIQESRRLVQVNECLRRQQSNSRVERATRRRLNLTETVDIQPVEYTQTDADQK